MRKHWIVVPLLLALVAGVAAAQDQKRESQLRTVRGAVVDKQDNPIASGVVYLKNLRTLTVKTYISDERGLRNPRRARRFHFRQTHHLEL